MQTPAVLAKPAAQAAGRSQLQADQFKRWFSTSGHWIYEYRAEAVRVWRERGINGLPAHSAATEAALADWVAADTLPALVAKWRAEAAA